MAWTEITRRHYRREGLRYERDTTDAEWFVMEQLLPPASALGRPRATDMRTVIDAILYIASTGCQWRQHTEASQRLALIFARSAIFIHALAMAIMASRYSGTEVRSSSAAHSSTWRLHSSIVSSGTMFIEMVMRAPAIVCLVFTIP